MKVTLSNIFCMLFVLLSVLLSAHTWASEQDIRNSVALGALVFADNCKHCHKIDGYGEAALYPSLRNERLLADKTLLIETVLNGRLAHEKDSNKAVRVMPSLDFLTNREVAAIIAFITNSWGSEVLMIPDEQVEAARKHKRQ
jgi:mono/diheme cytochrome c family protein